MICRKLDYVMLQMDGQMKELNIKYGSGLHGATPSISPLQRNLDTSLQGDSVTDIASPEALD